MLKDLFVKDKIFNVYAEELSIILKSINPEEISEDYVELVNQNLDKNLASKIKFDNEILHRSKVIKHFLDENEEKSKTIISSISNNTLLVSLLFRDPKI